MAGNEDHAEGQKRPPVNSCLRMRANMFAVSFLTVGFLLEVLDGKSCSKGMLVFFVLLLNLELRPGGACLPDPRETTDYF